MVMGRNGYGPKWSWAEMAMGRNDPESKSVGFTSQREIIRTLKVTNIVFFTQKSSLPAYPIDSYCYTKV